MIIIFFFRSQISSHFSFRRGTKVDNEVSDVNTMELCYQYLMQSDENKNGILSSEEYMAFIHRLSQKLQPTKIDPDDPTSSTAEKQHDDDIQHDMIRTNGNRLESIMVFNHLSHQTSMNMNQTSEVQQQEKQSAITKDTSTSTSCTSNASGEVDCSDSDITSIWLGNNPPHPEVKRQRLRYAKASEPLIWGDVFHLICDEVLLAMDLHTPQSLSFSRYGFAS